jgi:CheY-like chemotaxis protein
MKSLQAVSSESTGKPPPTVLVVVDEVLVRMAVSEYLRECGYNVVETSDAHEAIEVMTSDVAVDVAFSDIGMPGSLDGFGLAQWIRRERPDIKVVLSSGIARSAKAAGELCEEGPMLANPTNMPISSAASGRSSPRRPTAIEGPRLRGRD